MLSEMETAHHSSAEDFTAVREGTRSYCLPGRKIGRPLGAKDSKPRRKRRPLNLDVKYPPNKLRTLDPKPRLAVKLDLPRIDQRERDSEESLSASFGTSIIAAKAEILSRSDDCLGDDDENSLRRTYPFFLQI